LGSSRELWHDATLIPQSIVLYGNLPSKKFYSDELISLPDLETLCHQYHAKMKASGHPYLLGTECDVLCIDGCQKTLIDKAMAIVNCKH
jgi:hypothetical protein